jgi:hypothetical protein
LGSFFRHSVNASCLLITPSQVRGREFPAFWQDFGGSILHGDDMVKLARAAIECINHAELAVVKASHTLSILAQQAKAFRAFHTRRQAVKMIEKELDKLLTPEGMANVADVYLSRDAARAKEIADKALSLWPGNPTVLLCAYMAAKERKGISAQVGYPERVLRVEADNVVLQERLSAAGVNWDSQDAEGKRV